MLYIIASSTYTLFLLFLVSGDGYASNEHDPLLGPALLYRNYKKYLPSDIKSYEVFLQRNPNSALQLLLQAHEKSDDDFYAPFAAILPNFFSQAKIGNIAVVRQLLPHLQTYTAPINVFNEELKYIDLSGITHAVSAHNFYKAVATIEEILDFYRPQKSCYAGCLFACQHRRLAFIAYAKARALQLASKLQRKEMQTHLLEQYSSYITPETMMYLSKNDRELAKKLEAKRKKQLEAKDSDWALLKKFNCDSNGYESQIYRPVATSIKLLQAPKVLTNSICTDHSLWYM